MAGRATMTLMALAGAFALGGCGENSKDRGRGEPAGMDESTGTERQAASKREAEPADGPNTAPKASGPRECPGSGAPRVVINRGDVECGEARQLVGNSRGPTNAEGPTAWNCSGFARTRKGAQVLAAEGYQCTRADDAVSILAGIDAPASDRAFKSKSGNVACEISDKVRCDITEKTWPNPAKPAGCELDYGPALGVGASGRAQHLCVGGAISQGRALEYGETVSRGGYRCDSTEARMRCVKQSTGHGFELSRERARLF